MSCDRPQEKALMFHPLYRSAIVSVHDYQCRAHRSGPGAEEHSVTSDIVLNLPTSGSAPEISDSEDIYGWLIGSWHLVIPKYAGIDVSDCGISGEVHCGWALEGRAIQDVWIMPKIVDRNADLDRMRNMYGTTLRVWDPEIQAWRITWINPAANRREEPIGRRIGSDIVQIGTRSNGTPTRWRFTEITPDSFFWFGEALKPDGKTWKLETEFHARRSDLTIDGLCP